MGPVRFVGFATVILVVLLVVPIPGVAQPGGVQTSPPAAPPSPPPPPQPSVVQPAQGCQTQFGICRVACCIAPGTPCYCQGPNNTAIPGYAVEFFRPTQ